MDHTHDQAGLADDPRRQRILEAARNLLLTVGYDHATTAAIAATTHLSKATIYSWWQSKEQLFLELLGQETVQLLDDWMARIEADPQGGTVAGLYQQGFLALLANPFMRALYSRESQVLGTFVRRRGPEIYTPRYITSQAMVQALQEAHIIRNDVAADVINHILLLLQVGLVTIGDVFDPALFPPLDTVAQTLADLMQRALAAETPAASEAAKTTIRVYFARLRVLIVASFAT